MDTLTRLFDWIIAAGMRASLLTVVVLLAQALLRHRVSARWRHALWLPVLVVLLMPVFPESSWSVTSITRIASAPLPELPVLEQRSELPARTPSLPIAPETSGALSWRQIMSLTWLGVAAGMAACVTISFVQTLRGFQRTRLPVSEALRRELAVVAREIGLRRVPRVCVASAILSPAVTGLLRPVLLLPAHFEDTLAPHEARHVLKHELTHIKRGDLLLHALLCLLLALHWFNPLLWLAFFKARRDREAACDAQVLEGEELAGRVAYGHTLLKVETAFSPHGLSLGFVGIFQRGAALHARIQSIVSQPKPQHPFMKTVLVLGIGLLTFLGITRAATPSPGAKAPQVLIEAKFIEISLGGDALWPNDEALPAPLDAAQKKPGLISTLSDAQFWTILRQLTPRKGVDFMSAPRLTTRGGNQATVEVVREFVYKDDAGKETRKKCGVISTVLPSVQKDGKIHLEFTPQVVEFEGYTNDKNGRQQPTFSERKATVNTTVASGLTTVLELDPRTDTQVVSEEDGNGNIISSKNVSYTQRLFVFITAHIVDPVTGKPHIPKEKEGLSRP